MRPLSPPQGVGETTRIVRDALRLGERAAMVTYTQNDAEETERKLYEMNQCIPSNIEVRSWYSFLIRELARPYQNFLYETRIDGMNWVAGRSDSFAKKLDIGRFYFGNGNFTYSDKVSQFICDCNAASKGAVLRRLEERFERIYLDNSRFGGIPILDLLELILKSKVATHTSWRSSTINLTERTIRQKTQGYSGFHIIEKLKAWERKGLCNLRYEVRNSPIKPKEFAELG